MTRMSSEALAKAFRYVSQLNKKQGAQARGLLVELWLKTTLLVEPKTPLLVKPKTTLLVEPKTTLLVEDKQLPIWWKDKQEQIARLEVDKQGQIARLEADKQRQYEQLVIWQADKKDQLFRLDEQCAFWEADKQCQLSRLNEQILELKLENLVTKSKHAALTSMRPLLEVYVRLLYGPHMSLDAGLKEIAKECIEPGAYSKPKLNDEAKKMLQMLEGDCEIEGVANALWNLAEHLSAPHHYPQLRNGFACGGDLPVRAAMGIALVTAQQLLVKVDKLKHADFQIEYYNDSWVATSLLKDGRILF